MTDTAAQTQQGGRNKGPLPRDLLRTCDGVPARDLPGDGLAGFGQTAQR